METIFKKISDLDREWLLINAEGKTLGKLASKVAHLLRGKNKPHYSPHQECGDFVIIVNADKIVVTGNKLMDKKYYRHSGYVGNLKETNLFRLLGKKPTAPVEMAIRGMLPKNRLGRKLFTNVKVYAGPDHPHESQKPVAFEF